MQYFARPISRLIGQLTRLPGIGPKTAQRLAFHILAGSQTAARDLAESILEARDKIKYCSRCCNLTEDDPCPICRDTRRDGELLCVVENPQDIVAMEKTGEFFGFYHVLHGSISPIDGIGPEQLKIKELLERLKNSGVKEVIVATDPNVEGEATALYLARILKPLDYRVTRIAHGLPIGGDLEYADEVTLGKSLQGRKEI